MTNIQDNLLNNISNELQPIVRRYKRQFKKYVKFHFETFSFLIFSNFFLYKTFFEFDKNTKSIHFQFTNFQLKIFLFIISKRTHKFN